MKKTLIQWADYTWSPWLGCEKVSPGCKNCYIVETTPFRVRHIKHGDPRVRLSVSYYKQPLRWNKEAEHAALVNRRHDHPINMPERPRVFPSLCDWLDDKAPIEWLVDFLRIIQRTPNLDWLLLTKRVENWKARLIEAHKSLAPVAGNVPLSSFIVNWLGGGAPKNVWFGFSAENQEYFVKRYHEAVHVPTRLLWCSMEPLLGPIDLKGLKSAKLGWAVIGGESGNGARPCHVEWLHHLVKQCRDLDIVPFVKQLGAVPLCDNANMFDWPEDAVLKGIGEGAATCCFFPKHKKGGDIEEWPEQLRVREFPALS